MVFYPPLCVTMRKIERGNDPPPPPTHPPEKKHKNLTPPPAFTPRVLVCGTPLQNGGMKFWPTHFTARVVVVGNNVWVTLRLLPWGVGLRVWKGCG